MEYHGLSWIIMDYHGLSWIIMDYHGLSWIIMDYHGLSWIIHYTAISKMVGFFIGLTTYHWTYHHGSSQAEVSGQSPASTLRPAPTWALGTRASDGEEMGAMN